MCLLYSHLLGILEGQLEGWLGLCPCSLGASPSPEYLWQEAAQRLQKFRSASCQAFLRLRPRTGTAFLLYILLVKASHRASQDSIRGGTEKTHWWPAWEAKLTLHKYWEEDQEVLMNLRLNTGLLSKDWIHICFYRCLFNSYVIGKKSILYRNFFYSVNSFFNLKKMLVLFGAARFALFNCCWEQCSIVPHGCFVGKYFCCVY